MGTGQPSLHPEAHAPCSSCPRARRHTASGGSGGQAGGGRRGHSPLRGQSCSGRTSRQHPGHRWWSTGGRAQAVRAGRSLRPPQPYGRAASNAGGPAGARTSPYPSVQWAPPPTSHGDGRQNLKHLMSWLTGDRGGDPTIMTGLTAPQNHLGRVTGLLAKPCLSLPSPDRISIGRHGWAGGHSFWPLSSHTRRSLKEQGEATEEGPGRESQAEPRGPYWAWEPQRRLPHQQGVRGHPVREYEGCGSWPPSISCHPTPSWWPVSSS